MLFLALPIATYAVPEYVTASIDYAFSLISKVPIADDIKLCIGVILIF